MYKREGWRGEVGDRGQRGKEQERRGWGFRKMVRDFFFFFFPPLEIEERIAAINSSLSSLSLLSSLLGLLVPSHFHQRLTPLHTSVKHHYAKVTNLPQKAGEG